MADDTKMITIKEAAEQTNISIHSLEQLIKQGHLKKIEKDGKVFVDTASLCHFMERVEMDE